MIKFEIVNLEEIAEIISGQSPVSDSYNYDGNGFPFFQGMADFQEKFPKVRTWCTSPTKIALPNDILLSVRAPVGPVNICNIEACIGRGIAAIRSINVHYEYLFYFLRSQQNKISDMGIGSTFKAINQLNIKKIKVLLPSLSDQIKIATLLKKTEDLIQKRKESIELLDELVRSTFLEIFGDPVINSNGLEVLKLEQLGSVDRGVSKHRPRNAPELLGGLYPLVQTGDVAKAKTYIIAHSSTYSELGLKQSKIWKPGTVCITIAANIGKTGILSYEACFPDSIAGFIPNDSDRVSSEYIHVLFSFYQTYLEKNAPESAQKNINLKVLRNLNIPVPDSSDLLKFNTIIESIEKLRLKLDNSLNYLETLYDSLSQSAFNGVLDLSKVEITDPELKMLVTNSKSKTFTTEMKFSAEDPIKIKLDERAEEFSNFSGELINDLFPPRTVTEIADEWILRNLSRVGLEQMIKRIFQKHHFNAEILLNALEKEGINPQYTSSKEWKENPKVDPTLDIHEILFDVLNRKSSSEEDQGALKLGQFFYNALEPEFPLKLRTKDKAFINDKNPKEQSGIYYKVLV